MVLKTKHDITVDVIMNALEVVETESSVQGKFSLKDSVLVNVNNITFIVLTDI